MNSILDIFEEIHRILQISSINYKSFSTIQQRANKSLNIKSKEQANQIQQSQISQYKLVLIHIAEHIKELQNFKIQYQILQQFLQKQQTQIRKHIGIEQQLKLYNDSIKSQLQQCEQQKSQLLQNSKQTIKCLKNKNQQLFHQILQLKSQLKRIQNVQHLKSYQYDSKQKKQRNTSNKFKQKSSSKRKNKDNTQNPSGKSKSRIHQNLTKIMKTQYIQRDTSNFGHSVLKKIHYKPYQSKYQKSKIQKKHEKSDFNFVANNSQSQKKKKINLIDHRVNLLEQRKKEKDKSSKKKTSDQQKIKNNKKQQKISPKRVLFSKQKVDQKVNISKKSNKSRLSSNYQFKDEQKKKNKCQDPIKNVYNISKAQAHHNRSTFSMNQV